MRHPRRAHLGRLTLYAIIASLLLPMLLLATAPQAAADPGWWDANWNYRAPVTLTIGENGCPENYQYRIVLDKADNLNNHCLDNFGDVRFLENEDSGELSFWIENYISGDNAIFWVRREENSLADNTIYVYYGNALAGSAENGFAAFEFFDDFEDNDTSDWTTQGSTAITAQTGVVKAGSYSAKIEGDAAPDQVYRNYASQSSSFIVEFDWCIDSTAGDHHASLDKVAGDYQNSIFLKASTSLWYYDGAYYELMSINADQWYKIKIIAHPSGDNFDIYVDGVEKGTGLGTRGTIPSLTSFAFTHGVGYSHYGDQIFLREYVSPEPTASVGGEETAFAAPNAPTDLLPSERQTTTSVDISCTATDNDGDRMNVFFYEAGVASLDDPTEDGFIARLEQETWSDAHDNGIGTIIDSGFWYTMITQQKVIFDKYNLYRSFFIYNTSSLPDDAIITFAKLSLYLYEKYCDVNFDVVIQTGGETYPHDPLEYGDYSYTHYSDNGGSINTTNITGGYFDINLNTTGISWINKTGKTKFCLRSSRDIDNIPPENLNETIRVYTKEKGAEYAPTLYVEYLTTTLIDNMWVDNGGTASVTWSGLTRGQTYYFCARARDNNGNWGENSAMQSFTVNSLPTCAITEPPDGYGVGVDEGIQFESSATDSEGDSLTYYWDFGDGTSGEEASPAHTYGSGGSYTVTLTVNDGYETSLPDSITVNIAGPVIPPPPPPAGPGGAPGIIREIVEEVVKVVQPAKNILFIRIFFGLPLLFWLVVIGVLAWMVDQKGIAVSMALILGFLSIFGAHIV